VAAAPAAEAAPAAAAAPRGDAAIAAGAAPSAWSDAAASSLDGAAANAEAGASLGDRLSRAGSTSRDDRAGNRRGPGADVRAAAPTAHPRGARAANGRGFLRFTGEIDPFRLAELASGELVLFRKVWRDKQRFIQGAVIDRRAFLEALTTEAFRGSSLGDVATLDVEVGDGTALRLAASGATGGGARLAALPLSPPLEDVVLAYSAARQGAGPSERYILLLSAVLVLVLAAGAGAILLAGRRQIALAQQQRDFVSAVSHELKTPLTSIRMYSEMLREGWATEEKKRAYYDFIFHESERLSRLIANVLKLAGLARGLPLAIETLTPGDAFARVRPLLASQCANAGFTLEELPPADVPPSVTARIDVDALTQILVNLVDNAIKFSRRAGADRITVGFAVEPGAAGAVRFFVRDYGPGIEPDALPRIFDLFYRAEAEKRAATPGTGIGLALVRDLAASMQATMAVESRPGQTELTLAVPRAT
jgi:signal transduction histidine kinase